jgi:hypothetical protein
MHSQGACTTSVDRQTRVLSDVYSRQRRGAMTMGSFSLPATGDRGAEYVMNAGGLVRADHVLSTTFAGSSIVEGPGCF